MATESTRKHRPTIDDIRALRADAAAVAQARAAEPPAGRSADYVRAVHLEQALGWVLGSYAPGMPLGLDRIQRLAAELREAAAPATEAEIFQGLAE